jgi:hypothetical protein
LEQKIIFANKLSPLTSLENTVMKAATQSNTILSLPNDVLIETFKQLSAGDPKTPWRDLLHLGATCKLLNNFTRNYSSDWMKKNWPAPPEGSDWQEQLEKILSPSSIGCDDLENRLFREPILRNLTEYAKADKAMGKISASNVDFWVDLKANRESTSSRLSDIYGFLKNFKDFSSDEKLEKLEYVTDFLPFLVKNEQRKVLNLMSGGLAHEIMNLPIRELVDFLSTILQMGLNDAIDEISTAKFSLKMQFGAHRQFTISKDLIVAALNCLPFEERFDWMKTNIPKIFVNHHGIRCLVSSRSGCNELAAGWKENFQKAKDLTKLTSAYYVMDEANDGLAGRKGGLALLKTAFKTFLDLPIILSPQGDNIHDFYLGVLKQCIELSQHHLSDEEFSALKEKIKATLLFASNNGCWKVPVITKSCEMRSHLGIQMEMQPMDRWLRKIKLALINSVQRLPAGVQQFARDRFDG